MGVRRAHTRTLGNGRRVAVRQAVVATAPAAMPSRRAPDRPTGTDPFPAGTPPAWSGRATLDATIDHGRRIIGTAPLRPGDQTTPSRDLVTNPRGLWPVTDALADRFTSDPDVAAVLTDRFPGTDPARAAEAIVAAIDDAWVDTPCNNPISAAVQRHLHDLFDPPGPTTSTRPVDVTQNTS